MKIKNKFINKSYLLYAPVFLVAILFMLIPLFDLIKESLTIKDSYNEKSLGINNFEKIFNDSKFTTAIINTLILLFLVSPVTIILSFLIALIISKLSFHFFKNTFITIIFSQLFISSYSIGIVFLVLFGKETNFVNTIFNTNINWDDPNKKIYPFLKLVIFYIWTMSAISILLFVAGINKINKNKFFMVKIDNLNLWKQIWLIYVPNLKKIIFIQIYIFIFQALFFYPTIFEDAFIVNCQTLSMYIINSIDVNNLPASQSLATVASVILIILSFVIIIILLITKSIVKKIKLRRVNENF